MRTWFAAGPPAALGPYALNRALRILPLYFVVVTVVLLVDSPEGGESGWLRYLTLTQYLDRDADLGVSALGPLWSIAVEVQFYVLLPLIAWALARISRGSLGLAALLLVAAAAVSLAIRIDQIVIPDGAPPAFWRFNMPTNFLFFVPGMLLALLRLHWQRSPERRPRGLAANSTLWFALAIPLTLIPVYAGFAWTPLVAVAAFAAVGACVLPLAGGGAVRALEWRPLALLGVASYSLYVWHVGAIEVLVDAGVSPTPWTALAAVALPVCIAIAAASYLLIESPFLRLRRQWSPDAARKNDRGVATPTRSSPEA